MRSRAYYPYDPKVVRGAHTNLERAYAAATYVKAKGSSRLSQTFVSSKVCLDIPFFYSFNRTFASFSENRVGSVLQIGTNLRYEASLLNTVLRREQSRRALSYFTVGAFSSLRYAHSHQGTTVRSLFSIVENRSSFRKEIFSQTKPLAVLVGVNSLRNNEGNFTQTIIRQVGKQFLVKNKFKDRMGFIHSSVGSLSFSHLGLSGKKTGSKSTTFLVEQPDYYQASSLKKSFFVNEPSKSNSATVEFRIETKTRYEFSGYLRSIQGQRRKHVKAINPIVSNRVSKLNLEAELIIF